MIENIFAWTATQGCYPEYISINKYPDGGVYVTIRSKPHHNLEGVVVKQGEQAHIQIDRAQLNDMAVALIKYLITADD
jgi:hypothetical protein